VTRVKIAILDDYLGSARTLADWGLIEARADVTVFTKAFSSPEDTVEALRDFDVLCLMRDRTPLPAATLARLPKLRFISITGRGNATLDYAAAAVAGITVSNTERGVIASTSELVWALIMAIARHVPANDASLRAGRWQGRLGSVLAGKTLGVLGLGKIGSRVARYALAFDMTVLAWSPRLTDEAAALVGAQRVELDHLLAESDIVTVHVVLKPETRGLIGAREIGLMRPESYLVNTSRGPIIDESALVAALHDGSIAGAGLDVFGREPLPVTDPIIGAPNTVLLPHLGFLTSDNLRLFYEDTVDNVTAWLDGRPIRVV
jgi:phosphoglycerate dehydrogenase-like enzyme